MRLSKRVSAREIQSPLLRHALPVRLITGEHRPCRDSLHEGCGCSHRYHDCTLSRLSHQHVSGHRGRKQTAKIFRLPAFSA